MLCRRPVSLVLGRPARPPLFPYTTLFRSRLQVGESVARPVLVQCQLGDADVAGGIAPLGGLGFEIGRAHVWNSSHTVISYAVFCLKKKKARTATTHALSRSRHRPAFTLRC